MIPREAAPHHSCHSVSGQYKDRFLCSSACLTYQENLRSAIGFSGFFLADSFSLILGSSKTLFVCRCWLVVGVPALRSPFSVASILAPHVAWSRSLLSGPDYLWNGSRKHPLHILGGPKLLRPRRTAIFSKFIKNLSVIFFVFRVSKNSNAVVRYE